MRSPIRLAAEFADRFGDSLANLRPLLLTEATGTKPVSWPHSATPDPSVPTKNDTKNFTMYSLPKIALGVATVLASSLSLNAQVKVFGGKPETRSLTRLFYYTDSTGFTPKGQVFMDHGVPMWQEKYAAALEKMLAADNDKPTRWRFGAGAWTTLDPHVDLKLGGVGGQEAPSHSPQSSRDAREEDGRVPGWTDHRRPAHSTQVGQERGLGREVLDRAGGRRGRHRQAEPDD